MGWKIDPIFSSQSRVSWGEAAIQAYEAEKSGRVTLWHEPNITQILDLLDSKLLLQSAKHFPRLKSLQVKSSLLLLVVGHDQVKVVDVTEC